jgi:hypothetical protein
VPTDDPPNFNTFIRIILTQGTVSGYNLLQRSKFN